MIERGAARRPAAHPGGQTGLNLAVELAEAGGPGSLRRAAAWGRLSRRFSTAEDRERSSRLMERARRTGARKRHRPHAWRRRWRLPRANGYPVIVRPAYTLGGTGGGIAEDEEELREIAARGLRSSPIGQVPGREKHRRLERDRVRSDAGCRRQLHRGLQHGKRRSRRRPHRGQHRGRPGQTLSDREYQMLRAAALRIIRALGIDGGCNVQFALDPESASTTSSK